MEYQEIKNLKKEKQILVNVCFFNENGIVVNNKIPLKNIAMKFDNNKILTLEELVNEHNKLEKLTNEIKEFIEKQKEFNKAVYSALKVNLQVAKEIKEEQV